MPTIGKIHVVKSWLWEQSGGSGAAGNTGDRGLCYEATAPALARDNKARGQNVRRRRRQVQPLYLAGWSPAPREGWWPWLCTYVKGNEQGFGGHRKISAPPKKHGSHMVRWINPRAWVRRPCDLGTLLKPLHCQFIKWGWPRRTLSSQGCYDIES